MEEETPQDNEEKNINNEGSEKEKKKKKKKHKHKKHRDSESGDESQKTINKKNQSVMKDLIADCFVLLHVIGKGSFGSIYISYNLRDNLPVSVKKEEKKPGKTPQLKTESKLYQSLLNIQADDISGAKPLGQDEVTGVPKFYGVGELPDYYYMIIDFLGPNLIELFDYCGCKKFTILTVCLIALQALNRIENIHKHHYLHRDIKPENFLIGIHEKSNVIYLIDFGLSKRYKNPKTHQHIPYREGRALTGTARYVSINTHLGIEQSRRDDLESIGYMLIFFLKGVLPWQGLKNCNEKYTRIMEKKLQIPTEILCYGLPDEITYYLNYCKNLRFEDRPDYDYLRGLFIKLLGTCNTLYGLTKENIKFDWSFDDPATSIWPYFNKKNKNINASNFNSSLARDKDKDEEDTNKKKNEVMKLKKQLSNISEVNDFISNENNPNYERSNSSESGGSKKGENKNEKKKKEIDKNLIKEEDESKVNESEETVRESFQPVPKDLEAAKLNEELKNVFFQQAKEEGIDAYISKLMNPAQPAMENPPKIDLIKFDEEVKVNNNENIQNNNMNNNINDEKLRAQKKPSLDKVKEEPEKKEGLIDSSKGSGSKKKEKDENNEKDNTKEKENEKNISKSVNIIEKNQGGPILMDDDKNEKEGESNKNSKENKTKGREGLNSNKEIENAENMDGKRGLEAPMINSKNYTKEMENKLKVMEEKNKLNFEQIDINKKLNDDKKKEEKKEDEKVKEKIEEKKEEKKEVEKKEEKIEEKKEEKKEDEKKEEIKEEKKEEKKEDKKEDKKKEEKIEDNKEGDEKKNVSNKELQIKISEKIDQMSENKDLPKLEKQTSEKKEKKDKKEEEDTQYIKSFKTTKAKKPKNNVDKSVNERKNKKSLKTVNKETPGGPGETPFGNEAISKMKVSKENLIKISTEPVANYYSIVKDLGHGSYGQVKKVKNKQLNEIRAMKITNKKSDSSKYEIEILRKISHPNITNIFEIFADSKKYYVIMEFLEGGELFEAITSIGSFTEASACKVMKQILSAVFYLHSNHIVHRDLKPENIMLTQKPKNGNYQIKLIDFGTAKIFKPGKKMNKFIGTSYYIAPEVLKERYDEKCDVWSCGVILFILLCGYPPFNGNTNVDIFHAIQNQNPIFGGEEWEDITPEAKDLIKQMLKKNPNERLTAEMCLRHKWFKMLDDFDRNKNSQKFKQIQINAIQHMSQFVNENRFKQAVLQFIGTQFNIQKEEGDLRDLFKSMDVSGTGQLTKEEFSVKLVELYGENDGKEMANNIFNSLDLDGSGKISYDEFLSAMINSKKVVTEERLEKAFKMFDKDNSGKLSVKEIKNVFGGTEEQWKHVIDEVDLNNDGEVDFGEFKIMMINMDKNQIIERKKTTEKSKGVSED